MLRPPLPPWDLASRFLGQPGLPLPDWSCGRITHVQLQPTTLRDPAVATRLDTACNPTAVVWDSNLTSPTARQPTATPNIDWPLKLAGSATGPLVLLDLV